MEFLLRCTKCQSILPSERAPTVCPKCQGVLFAELPTDLSLPSNWISVENPTLWRYARVLPPEPRFRISLGEGFTPIISLQKGLWLKDEGQNPTGTFKARGSALAISMAQQFQIRHIALATAGNAGGAAALYARAAGIKATIVMPKTAPLINQQEVHIADAELKLITGTIADANRYLKQLQSTDSTMFAISTMQEPYRVEGKKTMGYEIWEQLECLPQNIIYPTGGGTGLVGIWKAFTELQQLGISEDIPTRMFAVQSQGCAPIVKAWQQKSAVAEPWANPQTLAPGLCVPRPYADYLILQILRESGGGAVAVPDQAIVQATKDLGLFGIIAGPEGAATYAGYQKLVETGMISSREDTLLLMTGSGYKYMNQ